MNDPKRCNVCLLPPLVRRSQRETARIINLKDRYSPLRNVGFTYVLNCIFFKSHHGLVWCTYVVLPSNLALHELETCYEALVFGGGRSSLECISLH